jgi:hypothetical protein
VRYLDLIDVVYVSQTLLSHSLEHNNLRELLDAFPNIRVIEDIDTAKVDSFALQGFDDCGRETTHRLGGISLHVEHDGIALDVFLR